MCSEPDFSLHLFSFAGAVFAVRKRRYITTMRTAYLYLLFLSLFATGCTSSTRQTDKEQLYVSILPLRSLVEQIVGDDFKVDVLVPAAPAPKGFEPTPRQYVARTGRNWSSTSGLSTSNKICYAIFPIGRNWST